MKYSEEGSDKEIESKHLRSADYILDERPSRKHNSYSSESNLAGKDKFTSVTILRHGDYELLEPCRPMAQAPSGLMTLMSLAGCCVTATTQSNNLCSLATTWSPT
uniref:Uncharacterized protein n=1 Tax=Ditylenchus dipsaci TaxID=166011 RepID=A0A915DDP4_9BILA